MQVCHTSGRTSFPGKVGRGSSGSYPAESAPSSPVLGIPLLNQSLPEALHYCLERHKTMPPSGLRGCTPKLLKLTNCMTPTISVSNRAFFSQLNKAGLQFSLCTHMKEKGLCFGGAVWTARQSKLGFSISILGDQCGARIKMVRPIILKKKKNLTNTLACQHGRRS